MWRKTEPTLLSVQKKLQISCIILISISKNPIYSWPMSLKGKWDLDFRREWQVNWFSGWPAAIWRSTVKNKILGQKIMKYICKNQNNSISKTQTTHIGWIKTMLFQLVRHQRQGWRSSLHAQVGQPAGAQTIDSYFFSSVVSCHLYFMTKIKVANLQKIQSELIDSQT